VPSAGVPYLPKFVALAAQRHDPGCRWNANGDAPGQDPLLPITSYRSTRWRNVWASSRGGRTSRPATCDPYHSSRRSSDCSALGRGVIDARSSSDAHCSAGQTSGHLRRSIVQSWSGRPVNDDSEPCTAAQTVMAIHHSWSSPFVNRTDSWLFRRTNPRPMTASHSSALLAALRARPSRWRVLAGRVSSAVIV